MLKMSHMFRYDAIAKHSRPNTANANTIGKMDIVAAATVDVPVVPGKGARVATNCAVMNTHSRSKTPHNNITTTTMNAMTAGTKQLKLKGALSSS